MRQLRVMDMYHAAFIQYNDKTHRLLKAAEPYITWGPPDVRTIRDLLTKRGFAVVDVSLINFDFLPKIRDLAKISVLV